MTGSDRVEAWPAERSAQLVQIDPFWIDRTEVANALCRAFVEATGHLATTEDAPDRKGVARRAGVARRREGRDSNDTADAGTTSPERQGNTRAQSAAMSTTSQPRASASSRPRSRRPTEEMRS